MVLSSALPPYVRLPLKRLINHLPVGPTLPANEAAIPWQRGLIGCRYEATQVYRAIPVEYAVSELFEAVSKPGVTQR